LEVKAFLPNDEWPALRDCWNAKRWAPEQAVFRLELNLYCISTQSVAFGKALSKGSLYLQRPVFDIDTEYCNPHEYIISGLVPSAITAPEENIDDFEDEGSSEGDQSTGPRAHQRRQDGVGKVLDSLDHAEIQVQVRPGFDQRLRTEIMPCVVVHCILQIQADIR
jgi:hypothetical protein